MPVFNTLVDNLMNDAELRKRFNADPDGVMDEYTLNPNQRRLLLSMDKPSISASPDLTPAVKAQVTAFPFPPGEFPPASEDFLAEGGGLDPQYPSPTPGIFRYQINPPFIYTKDTSNKVHRGFSADIVNNITGRSIELSVFGQSFVDGECELKLVRVSPSPSVEAPIANFLVLGTFRNSILRAVFSPPEPQWTVGHAYEVTVVNLKPPVQKTLKAKPLLEVLA